jgi:hypothetical protein
MSNTLHHVSHHLLGGWLSPGREYGALPWIGRWIQVQDGQTCFLTSLPWNPLVQHAQKTNVTKKKSETWSDMNLIPELVTHAQVATRSDSKLLRNFWNSPDWKMGVHTNAPRNIGKWTDIWTGNFPVGLVLLWGLKRGDFLAQKGAPKIGQKGAPQSPKPNGKLLMSTKKKMVRFTTSHTQKNNAGWTQRNAMYVPHQSTIWKQP